MHLEAFPFILNAYYTNEPTPPNFRKRGYSAKDKPIGGFMMVICVNKIKRKGFWCVDWFLEEGSSSDTMVGFLEF